MENYNKKLFDRFLAGIAAVNVKTHDEYDQFMRMLEKETNLKWRLGEKPTQLDMFTEHREKTCIHRMVGSSVIKYSDISYCDSKDCEIIEFSDLMKKENNMKFKVGDKVRVRSWGSMKEEFGLDGDGDIPTSKNCFLSSMKKYCGKVLTVREVYMNYELYCPEDCYDFDAKMLEPAKVERKGLLEPLDSEGVKKRKKAEEPFRRVGLLPVHDDESLPETSEKYQVLYPSDLDEEEEEEEKSNDFITLDHLHKVVELENPHAEDADWQLTYEEIKTIYNRIIQVEKEAQ